MEMKTYFLGTEVREVRVNTEVRDPLHDLLVDHDLLKKQVEVCVVCIFVLYATTFINNHKLTTEVLDGYNR